VESLVTEESEMGGGKTAERKGKKYQVKREFSMLNERGGLPGERATTGGRGRGD